VNQTRQQQILSHIKRTVSTILHELDHEKFHHAVVTSLTLSNDSKLCRIWVDAPENTIRLLEGQYRSEIQHSFMKQYSRRIIPTLHFYKDDGSIDRLEALIDSSKQ
jgi:ribosome-binding factor A